MRRFLIYVLSLIFLHREIVSVQILSKSKLEKCEKNSDSNKLNCTTKIIINMAVPSGSSGGEASIVAEIVEVEENSTNKMQTLRIPPVITINKSAAYALYELTYIRDVAYKPEEFHVKTRKCEPDAGANPICCPCGPQRRVPSSCGNVFDKMMKGKANTAHCLRFPGDWFHVFGIGQRSIGFSVKIEMKIGSKVSEVIIGPENRTATSNDNFLRVNLIGDFVGYSNIPTFEDFYLVIPRQNAGSHSFSIGVTEALNTNLLIELRADDIDYVFQRSPGKIISVTIPTFEALTQFGVATITAQNTGEVEASYSLTFDCSKGVSLMEEQFFIMKPKEISARSFKLYPTTDQAAKYICSAILKDSEFNEVDRAECQFSTTATILDNGSQITPFHPPKTGLNGFFESIKKIWKNLWESLVEFITGETCRRKCSGFFDFSCHIQYILLVLLWLLHQKGFFDPLYDWWEDHFGYNDQRVEHIHRHSVGIGHSHIHSRKHNKARHHKHDSRHKRSSIHHEHRHNHLERDSDYYYHLHHVQKDRHKHRRVKSSSIRQQIHLDRRKNDDVGHHKHRRANETIERPLKMR
ncbi:hypothetical protein COLO4_05261 [Corchorus olitorius]|uniref:Generative cell specific-1/HAP2 domain-containing protein n=1 Tax=Corchorus olitorius TaxID=93759 RepID=A0A1R3KRF0_9ROSI|nr:hypothetical protein COLO4_05261 [Corchorus olitorius]